RRLYHLAFTADACEVTGEYCSLWVGAAACDHRLLARIAVDIDPSVGIGLGLPLDKVVAGIGPKHDFRGKVIEDVVTLVGPRDQHRVAPSSPAPDDRDQ